MSQRISKYSGCLFFSAGALCRKLDKLADEVFSHHLQLSASHAFILKEIIENPGIKPGEVAQELHLKPSTITRLVDKLCERGLVMRNFMGKSSHLSASEEGKVLLPAIRNAWEDLNKNYSQALGRPRAMELTSRMYEAANVIESTTVDI